MQVVPTGSCPRAPLLQRVFPAAEGVCAARPHPASRAGHWPCGTAQPAPAPAGRSVGRCLCDAQDPAPLPGRIAAHLLPALAGEKPGDRFWVCWNSERSPKCEAQAVVLCYVPVV